ncbi:hypothetical protein SCATT_15040 [Streptantibioticus cattleyicolor NRRL 8057 = DSM 46488]|uniref:Uncharacterized protein n=1 Tax=Streptantibioticus cattleyicolor (strain ATCC 35852 / DSM 46488 / JCM 4925 / NBRC 14057 / NRRL 8057) TaxID=1003195 RepID=G8X1Y9_STREN|nr:hypothetical protein SCATT_15040 [Streptantibioticus cattleyicolor NRRL 8057 = DSM 46488]
MCRRALFVAANSLAVQALWRARMLGRRGRGGTVRRWSGAS